MGDYGKALLCRLSLPRVEGYDLNVRGREPRGILIAHCDWQGEKQQVAVTHLGLRPGERRDQVRRLVACLDSEPTRPLILMGDFNECLFCGRPLRWLHRRFGRTGSPATFPSRWPLLRLDRIMSDQPARAFKTPLAREASDRLPLIARYTRNRRLD